MAGPRLTIKEIAELAGVSTTAVSFAMNDKSGVSDATKERIFEIIQKTGFQPNSASRRLTLKKSFNVALVYTATASPFTDFFYHEIANGVTEELTDKGYNVVFAPVGAGKKPEIFKRNDADGAIVFQEVTKEVAHALETDNIPYVLVDPQNLDDTCTYVGIDCEKSIFSAIMYLAGKGHARIAFGGSDRIPSYYLRCFAGYQRALSDKGLPIYADWIRRDLYDKESAAAVLSKIMAGENAPTAICCMNDMCAVYAMEAAGELGINVPGALSFISIDDIILARHISPKLTTITYTKNDMGVLAARLLFRKMKGEETQSTIVESDKIIERDSVLDMTEH